VTEKYYLIHRISIKRFPAFILVSQRRRHLGVDNEAIFVWRDHRAAGSLEPIQAGTQLT